MKTKQTKEEEKFKSYLIEKIEYLKTNKDNKCFDLIDLNLAMKDAYKQGKLQAQKDILEILYDWENKLECCKLSKIDTHFKVYLEDMIKLRQKIQALKQEETK